MEFSAVDSLKNEMFISTQLNNLLWFSWMLLNLKQPDKVKREKKIKFKDICSSALNFVMKAKPFDQRL